MTPGWTDGAVAERLVALPGDSRIQRVAASSVGIPRGRGARSNTFAPAALWRSGDQRRRIETRLLTKQMGVWAGYSYVWNDAQDDATLAPAAGVELKLAAGIAAGRRRARRRPRTWNVPSRTDCMSCHSRAANFVLGLSELQADCVQNTTTSR